MQPYRSIVEAGSEEEKLVQQVIHRQARPLLVGPADPSPIPQPQDSWRLKERFKTVHVGLVLCLNVGIDPPDVVKRKPCAVLQCWGDPIAEAAAPQPANAVKPIENIAARLKAQYERWQPRARFKNALDPTSDDLKRLCQGLRKSAHEDRVLLHYNGQGCPKPTSNGEIWVFNKNFTQYIPLPLNELHAALGSPAIYVFDCSAAGEVLNAFAHLRSQEPEVVVTDGPRPLGSRDDVVLVACAANQVLPQNPFFPADLFTSCLTTPIKASILWFRYQNQHFQNLPANLVDIIPGAVNDRKTPLGELNWIFTAVTDTIAWTELPRDLFQRLFRQDLLLASLFRNFLLAERIMGELHCTAQTYPQLPSTRRHPMWDVWDLALERCIAQVVKMLRPTAGAPPGVEPLPPPPPEALVNYQPTTFFTEQLNAFELWLTLAKEGKAPPHLPIVLQVLLSPSHRLRALQLLSQFLDLGPWAVLQALCVGIFPYMLKLLQSPQLDLRMYLVFIWTKIVVLDRGCAADLLKENGLSYFLAIFQEAQVGSVPEGSPLTTSAGPGFLDYLKFWGRTEGQLAMVAVILSVLCASDPPEKTSRQLSGNEVQKLVLWNGIAKVCISHLTSEHAYVRTAMCLCLSRVVADVGALVAAMLSMEAHLRLHEIQQNDPSVKTRAAAVYCQSFFLYTTQDTEPLEPEKAAANRFVMMNLIKARSDASAAVRCEVVFALTRYCRMHVSLMARLHPTVYANVVRHDEGNYTIPDQLGSPKMDPGFSNPSASFVAATQHPGGEPLDEADHFHILVVRVVVLLAHDPVPSVASMARRLLNCIKANFTRLSPEESPPLPADGTSGRDGSADSLSTMGMLGASVAADRRSFRSVADSDDGARSPTFDSSPLVAANAQRSQPRLEAEQVVLQEREGFSHLTTSQLYEQAIAIYAHSLLRGADAQDLSGPVRLNQRLKLQRNERVLLETLGGRRYLEAGNKKLEDHMGMLEPETGVRCMLYHPFNPLLITSDDNDGIYVWNVEELQPINVFRASPWHLPAKPPPMALSPATGSSLVKTFVSSALANPQKEPRPTITAMALVNPQHSSLLLTVSNRGCVNIYRDYLGVGLTRCIGGFRVVPSDVLYRQPACILDWNQTSGTLCVSDQSTTFTVWDLERERCSYSSMVAEAIGIRSMVSDKHAGTLLTLGCADGCVRVLDLRSPDTSLIMSPKEHTATLLKVSTRSSDDQIVSVDLTGCVKVWDLRNLQTRSLSTINTTEKTPNKLISAFAVHDYSPVFAVGSQSLKINIFNLNTGATLSGISYHNSGWLHNSAWLGSRIGPVACLAFHPIKLWLAAGSTESNISLYRTEDERKR